MGRDHNIDTIMDSEVSMEEKRDALTLVGLGLTITGAFVMLLLVVIGLLLGGCGPKCELRTFRCKGPLVQTCSPAGWRTVTDCGKLGEGQWKCQEEGLRKMLDEFPEFSSGRG